jgi:DNA polymerase III delta prime subunit
MAKLATQFFKRVTVILEAEGIEYDQQVVAQVINKHFPDWRRVLNELQRYSATGKIDTGILANMTESSIKELVDHIKDKNYTECRKWVKNNLDTDVNYLYNQFYDMASEIVEPSDIPQLVVHVAEFQYKNAFVANPEINFAAFLANIMSDCRFK